MKPWILALSLALIGCGSSELSTLSNASTSTSSLAPAPASNLFSGRVLNEQGTPLSAVDVVLHERTSDRKHTAVTGADGSFTVDMPAGVYDLGLNSADPATATSFYGPIINPTSASQTFVLRASGGRPVGAFFGKMLLQPGRPAAKRRVVIRPSLIHTGSDGTLPEPLELSTSEDGSFEALLASTRQVSVDLEMYDESGLDEWIDVGKLDKPCYVEFATEQSPVENRLRANQSDGPGAAVVSPRMDPQVRPKLVTQFTFSTAKAKTIYSDAATLSAGLISVDHVTKQTPANLSTIAQLISNGPLPNPQSEVNDYPMSVADDGSWWWK